MSDLVNKFKNKSVLLWGYGKEGRSAEQFLKTYCETSNIEIYEGDIDGLKLDDFDYVIKSPGVPYIYENEPKLTSLTQLFLEEFKDSTIGITGTKGKSTTTSMLYSVLSKALDRKVCLLGNIGIPCLDAYEEMKNGAIAVYEMSCHQLANNTVAPHVAIFLNLYEDHLDYYKTKDAYFRAKSHITLSQNENDFYFKGDTVPYIETKANIIEVNSFDEKRFDLKVLGQHNQWNAEVVYNVATKIYGCDSDKVLELMSEFKGLSHRLEYFTTINGVDYFDDSISTIPEATINAIESVPNAKSVIVGGMDRGIDYDVLIEKINDTPNVDFILCYASGKRIYEEVKNCENVTYVSDLEEAVKKAGEITHNGACILSPAAASYGYFKNFEDRGEHFKKLVNQL